MSASRAVHLVAAGQHVVEAHGVQPEVLRVLAGDRVEPDVRHQLVLEAPGLRFRRRARRSAGPAPGTSPAADRSTRVGCSTTWSSTDTTWTSSGSMPTPSPDLDQISTLNWPGASGTRARHRIRPHFCTVHNLCRLGGSREHVRPTAWGVLAVEVSTEGPRPVVPVKWWAGLGLAFLAFQLYLYGAWLLDGPNRTDPGPIDQPGYMDIGVAFMNVGMPIGAAFVLYRYVLRPLRRDGRIGFDGLFVLAPRRAWRGRTRSSTTRRSRPPTTPTSGTSARGGRTSPAGCRRAAPLRPSPSPASSRPTCSRPS